MEISRAGFMLQQRVKHIAYLQVIDKEFHTDRYLDRRGDSLRRCDRQEENQVSKDASCFHQRLTSRVHHKRPQCAQDTARIVIQHIGTAHGPRPLSTPTVPPHPLHQTNPFLTPSLSSSNSSSAVWCEVITGRIIPIDF